MKEQTVCFTGHRKIPPEQMMTLTRRLRETIIELIENDYIHFLAGGALGFDTLAARTVLSLKADYPDIKLVLALPCLSQTKCWSAFDIAVYEDIKNNADEVVYTSQEYTKGCMHKRNRYLIENSGICICYLTKQTGGTAYTVDYANKSGLTVINLAENQ